MFKDYYSNNPSLLPREPIIKSVWVTLLTCLCLSLNASSLDSLIQSKLGCNTLVECFQSRIDICEAAISHNDQDAFNQYVPELIRYMDVMEKDSTSHIGQLKIAHGHLQFNQFNAADSVYEIAQKYCTSTEQINHIMVARTEIKLRTGNNSECIDLADILIEQLDPKKEILQLIQIYLTRGICLLGNQMTSEAIKSYLKAKELTQDKPEFESQYNRAEDYLIEIYTEMKSYDTALEIYHNKRKLLHSKGEYRSELFSYFSIINSLIKLKKYDEVLIQSHQAIQLKNKHNVATAFGYVYHNMGEAFFQMNQLDSAFYYSNMGIEFSRASHENKELADNLSTMSKIQLKQGEYQKAQNTIEEAMRLRQVHDNLLSSQYATAQSQLGEYKTAYLALRKNWDQWEQSQAEDESKKIAALLVEERFKMSQDQQITNLLHELKSERMYITIGLLTFIIILIGIYTYIQMTHTTKLEQLNYSLKHHNQALEQFAHITSHDLKEPVRNISSFASLLMRKSKHEKYDDDEREYISFIQNNAKNLYRMIGSIKEFTEVSFSNKKSEQIEIAEVFEIVQQNLRQLIYENNTVLKFHNPDNIQFVQFPKDLLILTLQNLVQNGIKYNQSETPKIEVTVTESAEQTNFKISDNGIGIDKEFQAQIFIPFKTLENKVNTQSSGLGLSICKNILENHGGNIWVESDGSSGSVFHFSI